MTETNHASEAAASSYLPSEAELQHIATPGGGWSPRVQAMAVEILRMRRDCPPTAEIEKLRHAAREENRLHGHLSNIGSALSEVGHPHRHKGDELERIRDLAASRKAWKREADTLGGDLNRIRSLVPTASDEQSTFDAVQGELQRLRSELTQLRAEAKRVDDRVQRLAKVVQCQVGDDVYDAAEKKLGELRAAADERAKLLDRLHAILFCTFPAEPTMEKQAEKLVAAAKNGAPPVVGDCLMLAHKPGEWSQEADEFFVYRRVSRTPWVQVFWRHGPGVSNSAPSLPAEAQTAIAAMRDVGPELAKAGIQVGPRLSHAEAIAQLRGERDRWREKFEGAHQLVDEAARFEGAVVADLAAHGVFATGGLGGVRFAVGKVLAELARLRKESKRDQVAKQQALLDEIARLFPGKGTLLGRVQKAANGYIWRELLLRLRDGIKAQLAWCTLPGGAPFAGMHDAHAALSCALRNADALMAEAAGLTGDWCGTNRPEMPPLNPQVAPATGQPRTEAPIAPDGSGTVVELGEAFRQNLSNAVACLPEGAIDPTTTKIAIRNLHACVAELAKVVERIGAR